MQGERRHCRYNFGDFQKCYKNFNSTYFDTQIFAICSCVSKSIKKKYVWME